MRYFSPGEKVVVEPISLLVKAVTLWYKTRFSRDGPFLGEGLSTVFRTTPE